MAMTWEERKRNQRGKVQPSGIQQQAARAFSALPQKTANIAENYLGGAGAKKLVGGIGDVVGGVVDDARNTRKFVAKGKAPAIQDPPMRMSNRMAETPTRGTAQAAEIPQTDIAMKPIIVGNNPQQGAEQYTPQRIAALSQAAAVPAGQEESRIGRTFSVPGGTMEITGPPPKTGQREFRSDGKYTTSNGLEIAFDPSTSQDERQKFMQKPVSGGMQRRSDLSGKSQRIADAPHKRYFENNQQQRAEQGERQQLAEMRSGMKRTERMAFDKRLADQENSQLQASTDIATTGIQEQGANQRQFGANRLASERNSIDRMNAESEGAYRSAQTGAIQSSQEILKQMQTEQDPAKREALRQQYLTAQGKDTVNQDPPKGTLTEKQFLDLDAENRKAYEESGAGMSTEEGGFLGIGKKEVAGQDYEDYVAERGGPFYDEYLARTGGVDRRPALSIIKGDDNMAAQYAGATPEQRTAIIQRILAELQNQT